MVYKLQKGWESEIRVPAWSGSAEGLFQVADCRPLIASSHGRKRPRELSGVPFIRPLIPLVRAAMVRVCPLQNSDVANVTVLKDEAFQR